MKPVDIDFPASWPKCVRSGMVNVVSLAHWTLTYSRSWCANSKIARVRLAGQLDAAKNHISVLSEELRIKDARMARIPPRNRPFYAPVERMAILELKAAHNWNLARTAASFMIEPDTVADWLRRIDDPNDGLVRIAEPINKYPQFVRHIVQRLKVLCPLMGKKRIAETLAHAGLSLSASTVRRILKAKSPEQPVSSTHQTWNPEPSKAPAVVTARYPNHVWHVDLTAVPTSAGFWVPWFPLTLLQAWPFCWWVAVVIDHYSRQAVGFAVFKKQPSSLDVRSFLRRAIGRQKAKPKYLISDKGPQFWCSDFKTWAKRRKIRLRFVSVRGMTFYRGGAGGDKPAA